MPLGSYTSAAFTTATGVAVAANADVEVRRESDSALASIFSDRAGASAITQPGFKADAEGRFVFYAAGISGGYQVKVTKGAESYTARYQATGTARELDADPSWASALSGALSATITSFLAAATKAAARVVLGFGTATDAKIQIGDGTDFISVPVPVGFSILNGYLDWTVAGNALTVAVKNWAGADPSAADPVYIAVRDPTAATGLPLIRKLTAATSVTASSGSTLGTINSTAFRVWCVAFDDAGVVRLGLINCLSGTAPSLNIYPLQGWAIASSTAEGGAGAADSAAVFYTGAAVTSKAYAVLGYATWETGLATAGTWSAGPTRKQLFGHGVPLPGHRLQMVRNATGALATGTTVIPADNTIPQNTEGDQYLSQAVTPSSAANLLFVSSVIYIASSAASGTLVSALFQDAIAGALAASQETVRTANDAVQAELSHTLLAGTTASTILKVRGGSGSAGTTTLNGSTGAGLYGGVLNSYLCVEEIMA